ncbi:acyl-CoA dehydrogenase family protein [Orrella sp. 11846]|uniref:acyl-CoA dehydrogenase family protein n=1 Tax=Orrella sp. 11846 TaxID=3409913 RepID=UPI003B58F0CC
MDTELYDSFDRMLTQVCPASRLREMDQTRDVRGCWFELSESGYLDVMVPESQGGADLGWDHAWQVLFAAGRHALGLPFGQTMVARTLLAHLHKPYDLEAIYSVGAANFRENQETLYAQVVAGALVADKFLFQEGKTLYLTELSDCTLEDVTQGGGFDALVQANRFEVVGECEPGLLARMNALALSAQLAGAADRVLAMTLSFAMERHQFGRSIGKFQALQQQITEMAERVYGMRMASQLGCQSETAIPSAAQAAMAKAQTSQWAAAVARTAHAVHGAIGVTREHDLQLLTRLLYAWARIEGGTEYWSGLLGQDLLDGDQSVLDYIRETLFDSPKLGLTAA